MAQGTPNVQPSTRPISSLRAAGIGRAIVPIGEIGAAIPKGESSGEIDPDEHVGAIVRMIEQPFQHRLPRPASMGT
jgi:hypothetical protein